MNETAYTVDLLKDLVVQFQDQPKLSAFMKVLQKQFEDLATFYTQLKMERWLDTAEGDQLDRIGDIVCLTRGEAGELASLDKSISALLGDEEYRKYLIFKIWKNTSICTYHDIIKVFKMFWSHPLLYSEDPAKPATILLTTEIMHPDPMDNMVVEELFRVPIVRAAGVGIWITAITQSDEVTAPIHPMSHLGRGLMVTPIPEEERDMTAAMSVYLSSAMPRWYKATDPEDATPFGLIAVPIEESKTLLLMTYLPMLGYHPLTAWEDPSDLSLHIENEGLTAQGNGDTLVFIGG